MPLEMVKFADLRPGDKILGCCGVYGQIQWPLPNYMKWWDGKGGIVRAIYPDKHKGTITFIDMYNGERATEHNRGDATFAVERGLKSGIDEETGLTICP